MVDILANDSKELEAYQQRFADYQQKQRELTTLREDIERNRQNVDFLQFQFDELSAAKLNAGEQEELEQQSETMSHAEDIKTALYEADHALSDDEQGVVTQVKRAANSLNSISKVLPQSSELTERLESCRIELRDIADEVGQLLERTDFDPAELDSINNRLDRLYELEKKYHTDSVEELITLRDELQQKLANIENRRSRKRSGETSRAIA